MNTVKHLVLLMGLLATSTSLNAADLGVVGDTWPIKEQSLVSLLKERARKIDLNEMQEHWQQKARDYSDRPKALNLNIARKSSQHEYIPVVNVKKDIVDMKGAVIAKAGTSLNVLGAMPYYNPKLLFINADRKAELRWADKRLNHLTGAKVILTGGSVSNASKYLGRGVFFDQNGVLVKKFSIQSTPAFAHREGLSLLINEIAIKEDGDER